MIYQWSEILERDDGTTVMISTSYVNLNGYCTHVSIPINGTEEVTVAYNKFSSLYDSSNYKTLPITMDDDFHMWYIEKIPYRKRIKNENSTNSS